MPKTLILLLIVLALLCPSQPAACQTAVPEASARELLRFSGLVVDPQGNPVADAVVSLWPNVSAVVPAASTGADGRFALEVDSSADAPQDLFILFVRRQKLALAGFSESQPSSQNTTITVSPAPTLTGEVLDFAADPIEGARVTLYHQEAGTTGAVGVSAVCDADGRFRIPAVPPSPNQYFLLSVYAPGFGLRQGPVLIPENSTDPIDLGGLVLPAADLSVSGAVLDSSENPVAGAAVTADPYAGAVEQFRLPEISTLTAEDGSFTLSGLAEGGVRLTALKRDPDLYGTAVVKAGASDALMVALSQQEQAAQQPVAFAPPPAPSLVGRSLPDLSSLAFEAAPDTEGKAVLVCLFDYESRPSRHMVSTLAPKAGDLAASNVAVLLIRSGSADAETVREWASDVAPSLPIGISSAAPDEIKASWCAEGLPWLILFDVSHTARFEGFPADELDAKVNELSSE